MSIKHFLLSNKLTGTVIRKFYSIKNTYTKGRRLKNMHKKGLETLYEIQSILEIQGVEFFFDMGTLLGIIREGHLLGHDLDIDIGVRAMSLAEQEQLDKQLLSCGCKLKYSFSVEGIGVVERSYILNGIKFDVNYYYREGDKDVCYLLYTNPEKEYPQREWDVVRLCCSAVESVVKYPLAKHYVNVPFNAEAYLEQRYGKNWRIPDKGYIYWKGPSATPTSFKGYCVVSK